MDRENLKCLRCGAAMKSAGRETIQLGQTGWLLGDLPNLLAGGLDVDIRLCPSCGKLEFFCGEEELPALPQKNCPKCGKQHDFDCPKCPHCGYNYYA